MKRSKVFLVAVLAIFVVASAATVPAQGVDSAWVVPSHLSFTSEPVLYQTYVPVCLADTVLLGSTNAPAAYSCYVQGGAGSFVSVPQPTGYTNCWLEVLVCINDLEEGTYGDTVIISVDGVSSPIRLSVELEIVPEGTADSAWVAPANVYVTADSGSTIPIVRPLYLASTLGPTPYESYVIGAWSSLLSVDPPSGITMDSLWLIVDPSGLEPGWYNGGVVFEVEGISDPVVLSVYLEIQSQQTADSAWVEPPSVYVTAESGSTTPISRPLWLASTLGPTPYDSYVMGPESSFVSVDPPSGMTMDSLWVVIDPSGLPLGYHTDTVVFEVEGISDPVLLGVTLQILPGQIVDSAWAEPSYLFFSFPQGAELPESDTVFIYSTNAPAPYACYVLGGPWSFVSVPDTAGYTNDSVHLVIDPSGLETGFHRDTVAFYVSGCESHPFVEIEVEITTVADSTKRRVRNKPNPFNPSTTICFSLERATNVELTVYDVLGRKVRCLHSGALPAGNQEILWDGTNTDKQQVSSGVYFYRLKMGQQIVTRKMMLLK